MSSENFGAGSKKFCCRQTWRPRKKVNAESWSDNMEVLMEQWGEKAAGLRFMYAHSEVHGKDLLINLSVVLLLLV